MFYKTKKEFLAHVWRNEKDTRWIDRAIARGTVVVREWEYSLTSEYLEELEKKWVREVIVEKVVEKEVIKKEENKPEGEKQTDNSSFIDHLEYIMAINQLRKDWINNIIKMKFDSSSQISWEEAEASVYKAMWLTPEDFAFEEDELKYINENIINRH